MRKKGAFLLLLTLAILFAALWIGRVPEPRFEGVPLGSLLDGKGGSIQEIQEAVRELGARAVPYLADVLEHEPTRLQQWYATAQPRFPLALQKFAPPPKSSDRRRAWAAAGLAEARTNAVTALPVLIKTAQSDPFFGARFKCSRSTRRGCARNSV